MDKQDPAARGANPGASQLSHPAMKQSADFIETRSPTSSRSRCFSQFVTSSSPRELPGARGEQEKMTAKMQVGRVPHRSLAHAHNMYTYVSKKKVDQGIAKIWRGWLRARMAPVKSYLPHFYPLACPSPCNIPVSPFLLHLSSCFICRKRGWHLLPLWCGVQGNASMPRAWPQPDAHMLAGTSPAAPIQWEGKASSWKS